TATPPTARNDDRRCWRDDLSSTIDSPLTLAPAALQPYSNLRKGQSLGTRVTISQNERIVGFTLDAAGGVGDRDATTAAGRPRRASSRSVPWSTSASCCSASATAGRSRPSHWRSC